MISSSKTSSQLQFLLIRLGDAGRWIGRALTPIWFVGGAVLLSVAMLVLWASFPYGVAASVIAAVQLAIIVWVVGVAVGFLLTHVALEADADEEEW